VAGCMLCCVCVGMMQIAQRYEQSCAVVHMLRFALGSLVCQIICVSARRYKQRLPAVAHCTLQVL
jgi:hypothetical protein